MFKAVKKLLIAVGKPFYWALELWIIVALYILFSIKKLVVLAVKSGAKKPKKAKKVRKPRVKKVWGRLLFLKLKLKTICFLRGLKKLKKFKFKIRFRIKTSVFIFLVASFVFSFWWFILRGLPSPQKLLDRKIEVSTKIYDRNGVLLYKIFKNQNRTIIPLSEIPMTVRLATLAAEDAEFYTHPGFSIKGIIRALIKNLKEGQLSGGSTITQQLVKNALLTPEKTVIRKIKEIILAMAVEKVMTKDQILEMYLNEVSYGGTAYGIYEASSEYFDKKIGELSLAEAAYLAGLTKSPTKLSPYGPNPNLAPEREKEVLHLMKVNKYITTAEENKALAETIQVKTKRTDIKAPHFVMYVRQLLVEEFGEEMVEKGGLEVITSLDYSIQKTAEEIVANEVQKLKPLRVGNGAALVLTPATGEVLAMVGSHDYFDNSGGKVNVTIRPRQPGSSIKMINYAYALAHGFTPVSILDDSPVSFAVPGQPLYSPVNYDGQYRGKITLRSALAESRNIPAVKVLASYGVVKMIEQGKAMGITTWEDSSRFGLSLTLGGGEVTLLDLARVYATVANLGQKPEIVPILKITDYHGRILKETYFQSEQVLDSRVAYQLIDILKDNPTRAPAFGFNSYLVIPNHPEVAVKTGTSNNLKDNLTIGFNQNYLTAVWVGNNDASPMSRVASGVTGASPIWNKIMRTLLQNESSENWTVPEEMVQAKNCFGKPEWFLKERVPKIVCAPTPAPVLNSQDKILEGLSTEN